MARTMLTGALATAMHRTNQFHACGLLAATLLVSETAPAQTATSSATVAASGQAFPDRLVNGGNLGPSTRPQNLTPLGINYNDCISDMTLSFNVVVSGFDGSENLQVWATKSGDCTSQVSRGIGGVATCWIVNPGFTGQIHTTATTLNFPVRVQDLVGLQNSQPPQNQAYLKQGPGACSAQATFAAVPIVLYFLPLDSSGNSVGTAFKFTQNTDLVGPPAPSGVSKAIGDTLMFINWNANTDSDTSGYDVFIDPIRGQEGSSSSPIDASMLICNGPATGMTATQDAAADGADGATDDGAASALDGGGGSAADASLDAATADAATVDASLDSPTADASCYYINVGGVIPSGGCTSSVLASSIVQDGGFAQEVDEAGNAIEGGLFSGSGGISTIPPSNLVDVASQGVTVPDRSTGTYTISGLLNDVTYNLAVAAVDGYGNIGPPSTEVCDKPEPVDDFWKIYRENGGHAGGGLCALEAVGAQVPSTAGIVLFVGTGVLLARRRTVRRRTRGAMVHERRKRK